MTREEGKSPILRSVIKAGDIFVTESCFERIKSKHFELAMIELVFIRHVNNECDSHQSINELHNGVWEARLDVAYQNKVTGLLNVYQHESSRC